MSYQDPCMSQCTLQYVKFMTLREFYIDRNRDKLKLKDLNKIEKAIDSLWHPLYRLINI